MTTPPPIAALLDARWFGVAARALLTLPFSTSGIAKLFDLPGALGEAAHFGLQPAMLTVAATILVQIGGSALLIAGRAAWLGAGALGVFTALATLIAHPYWTLADPVARFHERNTFLEHVGLIGGLMLGAILAQRREAR
ncbi:DoxX family protein [Sphingomonas hengshuiensis]|uniref:DoxX family protein n=1 Tax=Sphingomonas hengshuiensis TaxID=1609977 RepID=A0A7U4J7Q6_9SPHN|nr:DoxX family protein [Sphingomonas hengshuiensis]AJP71801.1 DoxX family protein [Sphingomonas hengshuiensis]